MTQTGYRIVSYSELDTFRQCPLKHHLSYKQRWTRPVKEGGALARGTLYHQVMDAHYRAIKKAQEAFGGPVPPAQWRGVLDAARLAVMGFLADPRTGEQTEDQALVQWMYEGYVEQYGVDPQWRILAIEHQIKTPLYTESGRKSRYILKAKLDLIVSEWASGHRWVIDHKSGKDLPRQMDLEIDDQFGLYVWALGQVGRPVMGAIHNANRTQRNKGAMPLDSRMSRTYLNRTAVELENIARDAYRVAHAAYPPGAARVPYSSPDPRQCGWKCDMKEAHLLARQGRDLGETMLEQGFQINKARH